MMFGAYETMGSSIYLTAAVEATMATDGLLPSQFYALFRSKTTPGWKKLLMFVLKQAMDDYEVPLLNGNKVKPARIRREVRAWVNSKDRSSLCCFLPLCEALDLHPASVRKALHWQMEQIEAGRSMRELWSFSVSVRPTDGPGENQAAA
jgi:hypothetical protein